MKCRIDGSDLVEIGSLGDLYVSDFIPMDAKSEDYGVKTPLTLCRSLTSGLVQLKDTADFDKMYKRYWYHSGTNQSMRDELKNIVTSIQSLIKAPHGSIWVDIGCNDGTLLYQVPTEYFTVGFDPATNNCAKAHEVVDEVINDYFSKEAYGNRPKAKIVTSIAMFYDLPDPVKFCKDVYDILDDNGLWVIQMSYLPLMVDQLAFDNICHEHLEYYDLTTLNSLLIDCGFTVVDCQLNDTNGGSFRIYVRKMIADPTTFGSAPYRSVADYRVDSILSQEKNETPIDSVWFKQIECLKDQTVSFIKNAIAEGKSVWAYGASTKGNTLLQYFGLDHTMIQGIAERQPQKYGLKTIGTEIPIYSEEYVRLQRPDYMLVLPWHFISEFKNRESEFLEHGGKFIVPCPNFEVIGK